ncbi:hypothetical protein Lfu02_48400 [Longispora fulva]|uniref:Uncharacterized protein n=1 Tax=Longispora fulva TaxID=619741 RepID=A0A8J7KLP3_9ACTN|nr:hypothetical protein [Longispora fulva]MBG6138216.1 hypothetical protein [Longispora fulva]GIG60468.1 hypothetical protein Lfu02_48400 [Longispora fulva]
MNLRREIRGVLRSVRYDLFRRGAQPEHPTHRGIVLLGLSLLVLTVAAASYLTVLGVAHAVRDDSAGTSAAGRRDGAEIQTDSALGGPAGAAPRVTTSPRHLVTRTPAARATTVVRPEEPVPTPARTSAAPTPTPEGSPTPSPAHSPSASPSASPTPTATASPTPTGSAHP